MCGIYGILCNGSVVPSKQALITGAKLISHRGPDHTGFFLDKGIGLAHTRLSIIDVNNRSNQPFSDKTGRYIIVYNGEIYNYLELKENLISHGVEFQTDSDTEVLLYFMIIFGEKHLEKLSGMFAFCFYDMKTKTAILARDRHGIKPLYYSNSPEELMFSSEQMPVVETRLSNPDLATCSAYLFGFGGTHFQDTFFDNIKILPPGHYIKHKNGLCHQIIRYFSITSYWENEYNQELIITPKSELIDKYDELLNQSIKSHMISDVPVGALCSGGVDSSLIISIASRYTSDLRLFHSDVVGRQSERQAAEELSKSLTLDLEVVEVTDEDFIKFIPDVTRHYSQPFSYHPNCIPFIRVTDLVKKNNIKVILTGEAADECFLGYSHIPTEDYIQALHKFFELISRLSRKSTILSKVFFNTKKIDPSSGINLLTRYENIQEILEIRSELDKISSYSISERDKKTFYYLTYHLRTLLHRNDMLGMASGIEARFPFLDPACVRFACNLPYHHKIKPSLQAAKESKHPFLMSKWILREVAKRYIPKHLSYRPKRGFPTDAFERMRINPELFKDSFISEIFGLDNAKVRILSENSSRSFLTRLMLLEAWGQLFFLKESNDNIRNKLLKNLSVER
ncbi:asparagine synthase (glutamine-hydrolyzing) [Marinobacter sp. UBA3607]|jgi:asparagine synthase (glutamine-hydrolysing)|uniref:asparagine synthase (glutamine-hydrolyzing) n=1 Tax=Marinobacter sp. UBA3607 TaxID=1946820 RepID=UPI002579FA27|nr:asparagine synthase (glutamine-hydrolyzing) [Marinobacter sp. UBA3607]|tara:strand:+ start:4118 stop:5992 length:1875 start_codon:yes stop_codon:yes gene_type:complete